MDQWLKVIKAAEFSGVSERTFRNWLKGGLKFSRLPSGHLLIRTTNIDEYLNQFETTEDVIRAAVDKALTAMAGRN